jgi:hypothetical protein
LKQLIFIWITLTVMDALKPTPLEGFIWTEALESLRQTLWPRDDGSGGEEEEPPRLLDLIATLAHPDDAWLIGSESDPVELADVEDDNEYDENDDDVGDGESADETEYSSDDDDSSVRYIELSQHPSLGVLAAQADLVHRPNTATFIVRNEYLVFMRHALSRLEEKSHWGCFFVAGQSGIGKRATLFLASTHT